MARLTLYSKGRGPPSSSVVVVVVVVVRDDEYCASASPTMASTIPERTLVFSGSVSRCCLYMDSAPWNRFAESAAAAAAAARMPEEEEKNGSMIKESRVPVEINRRLLLSCISDDDEDDCDWRMPCEYCG